MRRCGRDVKLPPALAGLAPPEVALFVLALCAAVAVNSWFFSFNLQRMHVAADKPVSRTSTEPLLSVPRFAVIFSVGVLGDDDPSRHVVSCVEGHQRLISGDRFEWLDQRPCRNRTVRNPSQTFVVVFNSIAFVPAVGYHRNESSMAIGFRLGSLHCLTVWVIDADRLDAFLTTPWDPFESSIELCDDKHPHFVALAVTTTQFVNGSRLHDFVVHARTYFPNNDSQIWIRSSKADFQTLLHSQQVAYQWSDLVVSSFSMLSMTVTAISFMFPYKAVAKHTVRCCWTRKGKHIDRELSTASMLEPLHSSSVSRSDLV